MARGRKNGCPTNIREWLIYILDKASITERWVRIYGLNSFTRSVSSETEDGSAETDIWSEPYVKKHSASLSLEGNPIVDGATGEPDEGQGMLDAYAEQAGCDGDATLKFIDPYGHAVIADYIVTGTSASTNESEDTVSWDLEQVGEPETLPYINVASVQIFDGTAEATAVTMAVGDAPKLLTVKVNPDGASNQRYRINVSGRRNVAVAATGENAFTVTPMMAGSATVTVTTMNGGKTASCAFTITDT